LPNGIRIRVDRAGAASWLADQLERSAADALPMVWHSITQLYWSAAEVAEVEAIMADYGARHPLARVSIRIPTPRPLLPLRGIYSGCGVRGTAAE
jgi:hypothetical protein